MSNGKLVDFASRWNKKSKTPVVFDPNNIILQPGSISLDIPALDTILGGGIPRGRTTVLIGEPSSGKTLLSQLIIAASQRNGGNAIFFDAEHTFDPKWFSLTGVDTSAERLAVVRPRSLEQAFDMIVDALSIVKPDVLVLDSIPSLVPAVQMKADMEKQDFRGVHPRKITEGVAKATQYNDSTALVFINQLRTAMNVTFGNPESMPGGRGLRHHASLIIRVRRGKWLTSAPDVAEEGMEAFTSLEEDKDAERIGFMLKLRTDKSKIAAPWQSCEIKFYFTGKVDPLGSLIHLAIMRGVIQSAQGYYELPGIERKVHGFSAVEELLRVDDGVKNELVRLVKEAV